MGYMGSYYDIPKAIFYLLKGDYKPKPYDKVKGSGLVEDARKGLRGLRLWDYLPYALLVITLEKRGCMGFQVTLGKGLQVRFAIIYPAL